MLALGIAAALPARAGDLRSHPRPARDYNVAVTRARAIIARDDRIVAEGGAPILLAHGTRAPRAVVLFHGFTDSPRQFAALADSLYARGDNVFVARLPHHGERGRDARELAKLTAEEMCRVADEAIDIASKLGDTVIVAGLSVGGSLAAWTAERRPEVRRVVVIAPAFEATHVPSMLERPLVNLSAHVPNVSRRLQADSARPDRDPGFATHGLAAVLRLGMAVRGDAQRFAPPRTVVLFVINAHDGTVKPSPVLDLAHVWNRRGVPVSVYQFPDSLRLPHNVIDPMQPPASIAAVYPVLRALIQGEQAPGWLTRR
jgi:pimeloyl-ACP methyl ester carboxylesterase